MTKLDEQFVAEVKDWAMKNYEKSFGASCIIECMSDEDILREFNSMADARRYAQLMSEQHANAQDY